MADWACFSLLMPTGGGGEGKVPFGERRRKTAKLERGVRRASVMQKVSSTTTTRHLELHLPTTRETKRERERAMQEEAE